VTGEKGDATRVDPGQPDPRIGRFQAGIGALLRRATDGRYLFLRRSALKDYAAGDWECVTGRVDQGEGFTGAVYREVREEVGLDARIEFILGTTHLYRGATTPENELVGVLYSCAVGDAEEHWLVQLVGRAERVRALVPGALLDYWRDAGFDID